MVARTSSFAAPSQKPGGIERGAAGRCVHREEGRGQEELMDTIYRPMHKKRGMSRTFGQRGSNDKKATF